MRPPIAVLLRCTLGLLPLVLAGGSRAAESPPNPRLTGAPFVRTWAPEDYGAAPVNYDLLQDPASGFIYVANDYGVLEFDGATWRLIELPNGIGKVSKNAVR